ncbi:outer membrane protein 9 [Helicobacter pylori]|nr:outer membrane protein 9 [Helicobacter pylori]
MKKFVVFKTLCLSVVLGNSLLAAEGSTEVQKQLEKPKDYKVVKGEKNAWYLGISYQVGQASQSVKNPPKAVNLTTLSSLWVKPTIWPLCKV